MKQKFNWKRPIPGKNVHHPASDQKKILLVLIRAFIGGAAVTLVLLMAGAMAFARLPLSGELVRPAACMISGVGAAVSGVLMAQGFGCQRLLCGLGSGAFYSLCIVVGSALKGGFKFDQRSIALVCMLLLAGMLGGALTAVKATSPRVR